MPDADRRRPQPLGEPGVLMLNATLTVRAHQAGSHQGHGWETLTDRVIETLSKEREGLVFILWAATHEASDH